MSLSLLTLLSGLPPNVDPWLPGLNADFNFSLPIIAPVGKPFPSPLAEVMISGEIG